MTSHPDTIFPFLTGCQRSGTTLLRVIFASHPEMAVPGESHFIPPLLNDRARYERSRSFDIDAYVAYLLDHPRFKVWRLSEGRLRAALDATPVQTMPDAIRRAYRAFADKKGKPKYADKTPRYALRIPMLAQAFPEARFVHVLRDGRDVALSLLEVEWGTKSIDEGALYWRKRVTAARRAGAELGPERYLEYKHEELLDDPEVQVRRICSFLQLEFDPSMLRYYENRKPSRAPHMQHLVKPPTKGLRDWREQMAPQDVRIFELIAGDLLQELGYERATDDHTFDQQTETRLQRRARHATRKGGRGNGRDAQDAQAEGGLGRIVAAVRRKLGAG
jgi:hypothetical protein